MKRYQVYLNPHSVSILDDFERYANIPRSKLIREAIDRLAQNLSLFLQPEMKLRNKNQLWIHLLGSLEVKNKQTLH